MSLNREREGEGEGGRGRKGEGLYCIKVLRHTCVSKVTLKL